MSKRINKLAKKLHKIIENEVQKQTEESEHYFRQNSIINAQLENYICWLKLAKENSEREGLKSNALKKEAQLEAMLEFQNMVKDCFTGVYDDE